MVGRISYAHIYGQWRIFKLATRLRCPYTTSLSDKSSLSQRFRLQASSFSLPLRVDGGGGRGITMFMSALVAEVILHQRIDLERTTY